MRRFRANFSGTRRACRRKVSLEGAYAGELEDDWTRKECKPTDTGPLMVGFALTGSPTPGSRAAVATVGQLAGMDPQPIQAVRQGQACAVRDTTV